jgi:hypothetical protein
MKSTVVVRMVRLLGVIVLSAVIGFSFITCGGDDGDGNPRKLTINGLDDYNGKYVMAYGHDSKGTKHFLAANNSFEPEIINGGSVVLNVWEQIELDENRGKVVPYNGSDTVTFEVLLFDTIELYDPSATADGEVTVTFTNGTASGVFVDISSW